MSSVTFRSAMASLAGAQKPRSGISLYSRFINRPVGRVFAAAAASVGMTPNSVTALSTLSTSAGVVVLATAAPTTITGVIVAALLVVGFALDSADGQVARLTGKGSAAGEWLDHVADAGKMVAVHAGVLVGGAAHDVLNDYWRLLPLAYMLVAVLMFSGMTTYELLQRTRNEPRPARDPSMPRSIALLAADYGVLALAFTLWGSALFLPAYALLFAGTAIITAALLRKWFRALGS